MSITLQKTFPISTFPYLNNTETLPLDVQCNFFLLSLYLSAVYTFFAGFTSFMGFLGTMQHLSWFTFMMRFLHIIKKPNFNSLYYICIKSDWQSLTCFQHWKKMNISFRILDIHKRTFLTARFSGIISFRFIQ